MATTNTDRDQNRLDREAERKRELHDKAQAIVRKGFPIPGLPPKGAIQIDNDHLKRFKASVGTWDKVKGSWYGMCGEIAKMYWGVPKGAKGVKGEPRKTPLPEHTKAVDYKILQMVAGGWVKHDTLTKEQLAKGILLLRAWGNWVDAQYLPSDTGKWDEGLPMEDEGRPEVKENLPKLLTEKDFM